MVGSVGIGGDHPIRVQSMTTTDTMDTAATVAQSIRMIEAGCELVRVTAPSLKEAENLKDIRRQLHAAGFDTPLVADIHFTPNAAELAARIVEKVRVNPGNYADKKKFANIEYTHEEYAAELERIRKRFAPLVSICKEYGTAMRIGTNHGSLSDRILSRYGDTPQGMVESAMEFVNICEDMGYHNIVLSMKASNTQVMVQAYRLLVSHMRVTGRNYPLHLGVTEAGDGEDGRIKSAVGIGTLLEDGLGDTIRVSLTEEPEAEIPVAQALADRYALRSSQPPLPERRDLPYNPYEHSKKTSHAIGFTGGEQVPRIIMDLSAGKDLQPADLTPLGYRYSEKLDKWRIDDQACDFLYVGDHPPSFELPGTLHLLENADTTGSHNMKVMDATETSWPAEQPFMVRVLTQDVNDDFIEKLKAHPKASIILRSTHSLIMADLRNTVIEFIRQEVTNPVFAEVYYTEDDQTWPLYAATDLGALLLDGLIEGIWIRHPECSSSLLNRTSFGILQSTRTRISKTEYISCPSCGRTLFDLQETTARIRERTSHLKGVKIGIMGCIVNGPGEMADADYGYVGTGPGVITLYKGQQVVKRNIPSEEAVDALINLIKEHGDWIEAESLALNA
ncbi:MAG: (E)-4-hydroxy-3-methylbut-2-enyl-diphosphate synthase [Flavobacteriales bacterium]|nr:(E)-4-hydroxy-3-methylbut-2-enyl-diphosphate synthase [Flavobacteriales bacterium]